MPITLLRTSSRDIKSAENDIRVILHVPVAKAYTKSTKSRSCIPSVTAHKIIYHTAFLGGLLCHLS